MELRLIVELKPELQNESVSSLKQVIIVLWRVVDSVKLITLITQMLGLEK